MKCIIFSCLFFCLSANVTNGQSLTELIEEVLSQNPQLQAQAHQTKATALRAPQQRQLPDPRLDLGAFVLPVETRLGAQWFRIGATQSLPWPGLLNAKAEVELRKANIQEAEQSLSKQSLAFQTKQAFYRWYQLDRQIIILQRQYDWLQQLKEISTNRLESGTGNLADVLKVELEESKIEQQIAILEEQKALPLTDLQQLMQSVETPTPKSDSLPLADWEALWSDSLLLDDPGFEVLQARQLLSQQEQQVNRLAAKPDFALGLDYILVGRRSDADPEHNGRDIIQLRASVQLPIFKEKYSAKDQEETIRQEAIQYEKQALQEKLLAIWRKAKVTYEQSKINVTFAERQAEKTQQIIQLMINYYQNGNASLEDILQQYLQLQRFERNKLDAIVQSYLAKAEAERILINY